MSVYPLFLRANKCGKHLRHITNTTYVAGETVVPNNVLEQNFCRVMQEVVLLFLGQTVCSHEARLTAYYTQTPLAAHSCTLPLDGVSKSSAQL